MADISVPDLIRQEAQKAGVPPELALSVAEQESSFNPTAIGPKLGSGEQAVGTFQLLPSTAKRLGVDPADPTQNIRGGVQYLRELLDRHQGNLEGVLKEYGGVKTDAKYVPAVLARMPKFAGSTSAPTKGPTPPPTPSLTQRAMDVGQSVLRGFDPRTEEGRRNWAGMAGATAANAALTAAFPEIGLPANAALWSARALRAITPIAGAYLGGATAQGAESLAKGGPPSPQSLMQAGGEQARMEAGGQVIGRGLQLAARRLSASAVSDKISKALTALKESVGPKLQEARPAVSPATAGRLFDELSTVATESAPAGPARATKDRLGKAVEEAAQSGPPIPTAPLRAELDRLAQSITPMASHEPSVAERYSAAFGDAPHLSFEEKAATLKKLPPDMGLSVLPPDHPLPAVLDQARDVVRSGETIPFSEAHKLKVKLQAAVNAKGNWDRSAKTQADQITKGFSGTLRRAMASHEPYNQATAAYGPVAQLYDDVGADALHAAIGKDPGKIVKQVKWDNPQSIQLIKDLTSLPSEQGGKEQGEAAFNAVRSAWTNERLIAKGPEGMADEIDKIEASNAGREFIQAMYGDTAGQTQWKNLKDIANALRQTTANATAFAKTPLASATEPAGVVRDAMLTFMPMHSIGKIGAMSRLVFGKSTGPGPMLEWASHSPQVTQFFIKHVLTGPNPGMALADVFRWWNGQQAPMPSHGPPPAPTALTGNRP